jgi:hypothetical protein
MIGALMFVCHARLSYVIKPDIRSHRMQRYKRNNNSPSFALIAFTFTFNRLTIFKPSLQSRPIREADMARQFLIVEYPLPAAAAWIGGTGRAFSDVTLRV